MDLQLFIAILIFIVSIFYCIKRVIKQLHKNKNCCDINNETL